MHHVLFGVFLELLQRPEVLFGAQGAVVAVEAVDPAMTILFVPIVLWARVPEVGVGLHHEILLAVFLVQRNLLLSLHRYVLARSLNVSARPHTYQYPLMPYFSCLKTQERACSSSVRGLAILRFYLLPLAKNR